MTSAIREIILTKVRTDERTELYKSEKDFHIRQLITSTVGIALMVGVMLFVLYLQRSDMTETAYWLNVGMMLGAGSMTIMGMIILQATRIGIYRPPTEKEKEELGDKII